MDEAEIASLLERYRRPAIMVSRPYPPLNLSPCRSHLGGRPDLPTGLVWPRTGQSIPLHFLAQIDCAELPSTDGVLPASGALFFFARIDEDMIWGEGNRADDCRVLFAPDFGATETNPPEELPQIMAGAGGPMVDFELPEDQRLRLYPQWPVTFHQISSWPDASALGIRSEDDRQAYQDAVTAARTAEETRALGQPLWAPYLAGWRRTVFPVKALELPASSPDKPFPQVWVIVDRIARHVIKELAAEKWQPRHNPDPDLLQDVEAAASNWVVSARDRGLDKPPAGEISLSFAEWLHTLAKHDFFRESVGNAVKKGVESAIQYAAASPNTAILIPEIYYAERRERRPRQQHQMLGDAGSSQVARPFERDEVLLLQLTSDYGVNFMFGDVGEIEFWISKQDLAERRFEGVFATTCGG